MRHSPRPLAFALLAISLCFNGAAGARAADGSETPGDVIKNIGDVFIYIVPSAAFGMTLGAKDGAGARQFAKSAVVSMGTVAAFKYTVKSRRPNGDPQSFPSGHTAICVQSAEFMRRRYGWKYGLPAYAIAGFVGYSRATTGEHYSRDVFAGALMAFLGTHWIAKPYAGGKLEFRTDRRATPSLVYVREF